MTSTLILENQKNGLYKINTSGFGKQVWGFTLGYLSKNVYLGLNPSTNKHYRGGLKLQLAKFTGDSEEFSEIPAAENVGKEDENKSMITIVRNIYTGYDMDPSSVPNNIGDSANDHCFIKVTIQNLQSSDNQGGTYIDVVGGIPNTFMESGEGFYEGNSFEFIDFPLTQLDETVARQSGIPESAFSGRSRFIAGVGSVSLTIKDFIVKESMLPNYSINTTLNAAVGDEAHILKEERLDSSVVATVSNDLPAYTATEITTNLGNIILTVNSTDNFPDAGVFRVDSNNVYYTKNPNSNSQLILDKTQNITIPAINAGKQITLVYLADSLVSLKKLTMNNIDGFPDITDTNTEQTIIVGGQNVNYIDIDYDQGFVLLNMGTTVTGVGIGTAVTSTSITGGNVLITNVVIYDPAAVEGSGYEVISAQSSLSGAQDNIVFPSSVPIGNFGFIHRASGTPFQRADDITALSGASDDITAACQQDSAAAKAAAQSLTAQISSMAGTIRAQQARYADFQSKWLPASKGAQLNVILKAIARYNTTPQES